MTNTVELFISPYCHCPAHERRRIRDTVLAADPGAAWSEVNALEDIDLAVSRGVRATPAIAVNGRVVTSGRLDLAALRGALEATHERIDQ